MKTGVSKYLGRMAAFGMALLLGQGAVAQSFDYTVSQTFALERGPATSFSSDAGQDQTKLEWTPISITELTGERDLQNGGVLSFGADFTGVLHPFTVTRTEHKTGLDIGYTQAFGEDNRWRIRLAGEADFASNIRRWAFQRQRIGARLQYRHNPMHTTVAGIRLGQRDQNEFTFPGYDQDEFLAELTHVWRPYQDRRTVRGTLYGEARRAESDQYSYDELGLRLSGRYPVSDETEVTARFSIYQREFDGPFAFNNSTFREDLRVRTTVEVDHEFSGDVTGQAFIGWDHTDSNIDVRSASGAVFGVQITFSTD